MNDGGAGHGGGAPTGSDSVPSAMISREDVEVAVGSSWIVTFRFFLQWWGGLYAEEQIGAGRVMFGYGSGTEVNTIQS